MSLEITSAYLASQGLTASFPSRFWAKVNKNGPAPIHRPDLGPCWMWTGSIDKRNKWTYGRITKHGRDGCSMIRAHRASWILNFGPIPSGLLVCHSCDNPPCVNPHHLFLGTSGENSADCVSKRRQSYGENRPKHKLTEALVAKIRSRYSTGTSIRCLAYEFGVSEPTLYKAAAGLTWKA